MKTSEHTTPIQEAPTLFAADSLANPPVRRDLEEERMITVGSGLRCYASYGACGPLGCLEKTLLGSSLWGSQDKALSWSVSRLPRGWRIAYSRQSLKTLERKAMPSEFFIYRLKPYGRRMSGTEYGLLPTTRASMTAELSEARKDDKHPNLEKILSAALIPTPVAGDGTKHTVNNRYAAGNLTLTAWVHLIPTPIASDGMGGRTTKGKARKGEAGLKDFLAKALIPTPTALDKFMHDPTPSGTRGVRQLPNFLMHGTSLGYTLRPAFVEWMMGYPNGWTNVNGWRSADSLSNTEWAQLNKRLALIFPGWTPGTALKQRRWGIVLYT